MSKTLIEWSMVNGEIVDVYLFKSDILEIPTTEGEQFDMSYYEDN